MTPRDSERPPAPRLGSMHPMVLLAIALLVAALLTAAALVASIP